MTNPKYGAWASDGPEGADPALPPARHVVVTGGMAMLQPNVMRAEDASQLVALARNASPEARARLAQSVAELFAVGLSPRERALAGEILLGIVKELALELRREIAHHLAPLPDAPPPLMAWLAEDALEVARPVLQLSAALTDQDLIRIILTHGSAQRALIAARATVSHAVAAELVATGDAEAVLALLSNPNVPLETGLWGELVALARRFELLHAPLLERRDAPAAVAVDLYWWVSRDLRRAILKRFPIPAATLDAALDEAMAGLSNDAAAEAAGRPPSDAALAWIARLVESDGVTGETMVRALRLGRLALFRAQFAALSGLPADLLPALFQTQNAEKLAVVARAIGLTKAEFSSIYLLTRPAGPTSGVGGAYDLSQVLGYFDSLTPAFAAGLALRWRESPALLARWD